MSLRLHFLGAAREVTGSMFVLDTPGGSLLVDCGMFQGRRAESRERNATLPARAVDADAAILTHAHVDHSGNLPMLVKRGYRGAIWSTAATRDVAALMLHDSARIQAADAEYLNRVFADERGWVPIEPLYDEADVDDAMRRFIGVPYRHDFAPLPGVRARLLDAGHILGSAQVVLDVDDHGVHRRIVFSGDLGRAGLPLLCDPEPPPRPVDVAILESTYGNRLHGDVASMHADLERVVRETVARGGKVVIPSFALGRTQELLYVLHELHRAGRLPRVPVYVDSPLATSVTAVFTLHHELLDRPARERFQRDGALFDFEGVHYVKSREDSMAINALEGPAVIISASGMAESGRILHHLRNTVEDPRNTVVIVGFMAEHTLGRRLVERRPRVRILGIERELNARVEVLNAFSAHADRDGLLAWAEACGDLRALYLVHGEPDQQAPLLDALRERGLKVSAPHRLETVELP